MNTRAARQKNKANPATKNHWLRKIWETTSVVLITLALVLLFRVLAFEVYRIPSGSMLPNLEIGDFIIVKKYEYGYSRYSLPFGNLLGIEGRVLGDEPVRGEMAIFRKPTDPTITFVKRIVGLPGDEIQVVGGRLHINGEETNRNRLEPFVRPEWEASAIQYWEESPDIKGHSIIELYGDSSPYTDNTQVYRIPPNHYFAMGDNRDSSLDSRFLTETGYVPYDNLVGKPVLVLFSFDASAASGFWFRFDRFFRLLD